MAVNLYFPSDEFDNARPNADLAADYLELTAFFHSEGQAFTKDLVNAIEIGANEDYPDVDTEVETREQIASDTATRIEARSRFVGDAYPFELDPDGDVLTYNGEDLTIAQASYLVSLILSHLRSVSPVLDGSPVYPSDDEVRNLRQYFQYFATSALAAEVQGQAWSFGHPRPDHTGFFEKLRSIWTVLRDGSIDPDYSAPGRPQDDQIDVFAWRPHADGNPGFILAAAQVATGDNWRTKSLSGHFPYVFWNRWFGRQPVSQTLNYHIIPFARPDDQIRDDVLVLGNLLHRTRLPRRVSEAAVLIENGVSIEAYENLGEAISWLRDYRARGLTA